VKRLFRTIGWILVGVAGGGGAMLCGACLVLLAGLFFPVAASLQLAGRVISSAVLAMVMLGLSVALSRRALFERMAMASGFLASVSFIVFTAIAGR
jgi:hypothetical protein